MEGMKRAKSKSKHFDRRVLNKDAFNRGLGTFLVQPTSSVQTVAEQTRMSAKTVRKAYKL